ncbi:MAG: hypothetical protein FJ253_10300 [Phycisphaerae bacterium]|nr:hypothetical protein [Phycisphaerae bacterium]
MTHRSSDAIDSDRRVLVTYAWVRSSYAVLRNLTDHGIRVWAADLYRTGMCQSSRRSAGFVRYPTPYADEPAFVRFIANACRERGIGLVFPSHNETEVLARHRELLPPGADRLLPSAEHCALFNHKAATYSLAESLGLRVPRRVLYRDPSEIPRLARDMGTRDLVIKLLTGNSARGVVYGSTAEQAQRKVDWMIERYALPPSRYPQVEERVTGDGAGCSVLYWHGRRIATFCHRRLRERVWTGGTSTLRESIASPELEQAACRLFDHVGWHGLAMSEFKLAADGGAPWFIEVNPRLWGSLPLAVSAGVEFPYLLWCCAVLGPDAAIEHDRRVEKRIGHRARWLWGDCMLALSQVMRLHPVEATHTLLQTRADSLDDLHQDDMGAFRGELMRYAVRAFTGRSRARTREGALR